MQFSSEASSLENCSSGEYIAKEFCAEYYGIGLADPLGNNLLNFVKN